VSTDAKSPAASISPSQCRAARALIDMDHAELARRAVVARDVIVDFENGSLTPSANDLAAIRAALEAVGVIFREWRRPRRQAKETRGVRESARLRAVRRLRRPLPSQVEQIVRLNVEALVLKRA
jgi:hypothetical protein